MRGKLQHMTTMMMLLLMIKNRQTFFMVVVFIMMKNQIRVSAVLHHLHLMLVAVIHQEGSKCRTYSLKRAKISHAQENGDPSAKDLSAVLQIRLSHQRVGSIASCFW